MTILRSILILFISCLVLTTSAQGLNEAGELFNQGIQFAKDKNYSAAIDAYQKTIDMTSALGDEGMDLMMKAEQAIVSAYYNYGVALYKEKKYGDAIKEFKLAAEKANQVGDAKTAGLANTYLAGLYTGIGNSKLKKEDYDAAIEQYKAALSYKPDYLKAYYGMGLVYKKQEDFAKMKEAMDNVIDMGEVNDPTVQKAKSTVATTCLNAGAVDLQRMKYEDAVQHLNSSAQYDPSEAQTYYYLSVAYNGLEKWDEAIASANMAKDKGYGEASDIYFQIGQASEGKGDSAAACQAYAQVTAGPNVDAAKYQMTQILKCN
jgi:tetratricopeptide (TPR) repeat protein